MNPLMITRSILFLIGFYAVNNINFSLSKEEKIRLLPQIKKIEKNNKRVSFLGSVQYPVNFNYSYLNLCYNGKLIKVKNDNLAISSFIVKDFDCKQLFLLIVSPDNLISTIEKDNTLLNFKLKKESEYKFYILSKKKGDEEELEWCIEESRLQNFNNNLEIPLNTFILFINPNSVDFKIENNKWKKDSLLVELPKIIINSVKVKSELEKSYLAFIDIKAFHAAQEKKEIIKNNTKIYMLV